jgi:ubiquinol-cytochrome c reductase cytochrome b subunit
MIDYNNFFRREMAIVINEHAIKYPTPVNLNYFWGFGSLAGICLVIQIISGILLAMHYAPEIHIAFYSIEHILRSVPNGWLLRYVHSNGASIFFIIVYTHIFRGVYYGSYIYPRHILWISGVIIFILMMATAFMGYVLPWGQMSFWGATVITNLFSAIPCIGQDIAYFLWGGFSVDNPTLNRFFSLHYLLPFIIVGFVGLHLILLHTSGSTNPLSLFFFNDKIPFYPYFYVKDLLGLIYLLILFTILVFFYPNLLGHPDNYIPANSLVTPAHIVPEWYFLPFYAILRSIPDKLGGVLCMGLAIAILFFLPLFYKNIYLQYNSKYFLINIIFFCLFFNTLILGWVGACAVEPPYLIISQISTFFYFFLFFFSIYFNSIFKLKY